MVKCTEDASLEIILKTTVAAALDMWIASEAGGSVKMLALAAVTEIIVDPKVVQPTGAATFTKQESVVE